jgi:hypothetical protein
VSARGCGALGALTVALLHAGLMPPELHAQTAQPQWNWVAPTAWQQTGRLVHPRLAEVSGVAPSRAHPGLLWVINDSGNPPDLLAVDSTGTLLGWIPLRGAPNTDWEEIALGPCGDGTCLYIADTGDNRERRDEVAIHRLVEPPPPEGGVTPALPVATLRVRYPDGPHDVEAMGVLPDGTILLVTKGRSGGILAFRIPSAAWAAGSVAVAERADSLPITAAIGTGRAITGMAVSPDGRRVMVRTYRDLFPFVLEDGARFRPLGEPTACDILGREPQGEAVGWLADGRLILLSERGLLKEGTVFVGRCGT